MLTAWSEIFPFCFHSSFATVLGAWWCACQGFFILPWRTEFGRSSWLCEAYSYHADTVVIWQTSGWFRPKPLPASGLEKQFLYNSNTNGYAHECDELYFCFVCCLSWSHHHSSSDRTATEFECEWLGNWKTNHGWCEAGEAHNCSTGSTSLLPKSTHRKPPHSQKPKTKSILMPKTTTEAQKWSSSKHKHAGLVLFTLETLLIGTHRTSFRYY